MIGPSRLEHARRIAHVTLQPLEHDARVSRTVSAMRDAGREVIVVAPGQGFDAGSMSVSRKLAIGLRYAAGARAGLKCARAAFWSFREHRAALEALLAAKPDAIHAHDWDGLVIGARAARELGVPLVYDSHELAVEMHLERRLWRLAVRPLIMLLEADAIRAADAVIVVSPGLAAVMQSMYGLKSAPILVRNLPDLAPVPSVARRGRDDPMLVHYHGVLAEGRELLSLVNAIAMTPPRFKLRLTGPWRQARFKKALLGEVDRLDLADRVEINSPVPFDQLVSHAADADVGVVLLPEGSRHNRFSLPNKLFEYLYAGLCIIAPSHAEDVASLVQEHTCGMIIDKCSPEDIASALERLDRVTIDRYRDASRAAADRLGWRDEAVRLLAIYGVGGNPEISEGSPDPVHTEDAPFLLA